MTKRYEFIELPLPSERRQKQRYIAAWVVALVALVILVRVL